MSAAASTGLRATLEAAMEADGLSMKDLTVLSPQNDPFRVDTPAGHRDGEWLGLPAAEVEYRLIGGVEWLIFGGELARLTATGLLAVCLLALIAMRNFRIGDKLASCCCDRLVADTQARRNSSVGALWRLYQRGGDQTALGLCRQVPAQQVDLPCVVTLGLVALEANTDYRRRFKSQLSTYPLPLIDSDWDHAEQSRRLIDHKAYRNGTGR